MIGELGAETSAPEPHPPLEQKPDTGKNPITSITAQALLESASTSNYMCHTNNC